MKKCTFMPQKQRFSINAAADVQCVFCLPGRWEGLTENVRYECHHSSMFLIGGIGLVATVPCSVLPYWVGSCPIGLLLI